MEFSPVLGNKVWSDTAKAQEGLGSVGIARGRQGEALWTLNSTLEAKEEKWGAYEVCAVVGFRRQGGVLFGRGFFAHEGEKG